MVRHFVDAIWSGVIRGYGSDIIDHDFDTPDRLALEAMLKDVWQFSAAKNYQQLRAMTMALVDEKGNTRSFKDFRNAAKKVTNEFVGSWLKTEYNFAVAGGQMSAKWQRIQEDKDIFPLLKYETVGDDRVRPAHRELDKVVKHVDDPFWNIYYPPNGWNCRCDVIQLQKGKETPTDNIIFPENMPTLFKTNLAMQGLVFPKNHPYYKDNPNYVQETAERLSESAKNERNFVDDPRVQKKISFIHINENLVNEIKEKYQYTDIDLLKLSGGIPVKYYDLNYKIAIHYGDALKIMSKNDVYDIERIIYPAEKKIYNAFMEVHDTGSGIGTKLFANQVESAIEMGYQLIEVTAGKSRSMNGYYTWARLGYTMDDDSEGEFADLMYAYEREEQTLEELMRTKEGRAFWKRYGFQWHGRFDLTSDSLHVERLNNYLKQKGIQLIRSI